MRRDQRPSFRGLTWFGKSAVAAVPETEGQQISPGRRPRFQPLRPSALALPLSTRVRGRVSPRRAQALAFELFPGRVSRACRGAKRTGCLPWWGPVNLAER